MIKLLQIIILVIIALLMMSSSCDKGSEGCTDSTACNYDETAANDDNSCWFASVDCNCNDPRGSQADCFGICDTDISNNPPDDDGDGNCNEDVLGGCIDTTICNYNQFATHNNDSCAVDLSHFGGSLDGTDCNEYCGGMAVMDECELCVGGTTNLGKCWKMEIKSIATFKLQDGLYMGADTNSITIGTSKYALDGYNGVVIDEGNTECKEGYDDVLGLLKTEENSTKNNYINFFIPHEEEWGSQFNFEMDPYFNRDIRANDYHSLFTDEKGMNWSAVIEPTFFDTLMVDENETIKQYKAIIDSIKFQFTFLEGIKCAVIKIYLDREEGETSGGIEYVVENNQLGIGLESDKEINVTINVSNICIQEFNELQEYYESCSDGY